MRFKATDEQIKTMAALVCNASRGVGMGMLHFDPQHEAKPEDFSITEDSKGRRDLTIDYWNGRMVKFWLKNWSAINAPTEPGIWYLMPEVPRHNYQSWARKYPTMESLIKAAGAEVLR